MGIPLSFSDRGLLYFGLKCIEVTGTSVIRPWGGGLGDIWGGVLFDCFCLTLFRPVNTTTEDIQ